MPQVTRSPLARQDLEEIIDYLSDQSAQVVERFVAKLDERCALHARFPLLGASAEELSPGLRQFVVGRYTVFYRPIPDGIDLIRVLHGARDLTQFFDE